MITLNSSRRWLSLGSLLCVVLTLLTGRTLASGPPPEAVLRAWINNHVVSPSASEAVLQAFYLARGYHPVWDPRSLESLREALQSVHGDGLRPEDYGRDRLESWLAPYRAQGLAEGRSLGTTAPLPPTLEWQATLGFLEALEDLAWGKVEPATVERTWNFTERPRGLHSRQAILEMAVATENPNKALQAARSPHPLYRQLRGALAELQAQAAHGGWRSLPEGPTLKPGQSDPRVPRLRERLAMGRWLPAQYVVPNDPSLFDPGLEVAVSAFQRAHYLEDDGQVGRQTRQVLNVPLATRIDQLRVNLERARWLLHDVPADFLLVDIAGYRATLYRDGEKHWASRVQVGKPFRETPVFRSAIDHVTLNPTWTVPPTIYKEDILPRLREDPGYLVRNNIRVLDPGGRQLARDEVDWTRPGNVILRQDAGPGSALGQAAIRFRNPYSVYLHDTPHQALFQKHQRAFSSGCIRVEGALELVALLLEGTPGWQGEALQTALDSGRTRNVFLKAPLPILMAYWTVSFDEQGRPGFKPDIYARDGAVLKRLDNVLVVPATQRDG